MHPQLTTRVLKGQSVRPYIPHLAKLRMSVFREYPYLYDGDLDYETDYLHTYTSCEDSLLVIIFHGERVVGVATAIPLIFEPIECQKPFLENDYKIDKIFYLGEEVIMPEYRSEYVYRLLFDLREQAAIEYGCQMTTFCSVERNINDSRRPQNFVELDAIWSSLGYVKNSDLCAYYFWRDVGETSQTPKPMHFWLKQLQNTSVSKKISHYSTSLDL